VHHATSGNLGKRGRGDVWTMTVREYRSASSLQRFKYRAYRHPFVLFGVGPLALFVVWERFTGPRDTLRSRLSVYATNLALAVAVWLACAGGVGRFLAVQLPITLIGSTVAVWLFYMQHQYEDTYWEWPGHWSFPDSALQGASYYALPRLLAWFTGNIGVHHVHHLNPRIANYRLQRCMDEVPWLQQPKRLTLRSALGSLRLALWDEERRRLVSFQGSLQ
jgi:omega-6 fatty acid desaturase (delta-12 desaturase)